MCEGKTKREEKGVKAQILHSLAVCLLNGCIYSIITELNCYSLRFFPINIYFFY